jgi:hypothetical protein
MCDLFVIAPCWLFADFEQNHQHVLVPPEPVSRQDVRAVHHRVLRRRHTEPGFYPQPGPHHAGPGIVFGICLPNSHMCFYLCSCVQSILCEPMMNSV